MARQLAAGPAIAMARLRLALPLMLSIALAGCASESAQSLLTSSAGSEPTGSLSSLGDKSKSAGATRDDWASASAKNPRDVKAAIAYARSLKAEGEKAKAMSVLQQAAIYNPDSVAVTGEMGRLALDMGQTDLAGKLLNRANDAKNPDWRVVNALGALAAQTGDKAGAKRYFEQAAQLAPREPSVLNNLALAYALDGDPAKAEGLLRRAAAAGGDTAKVRQNLALVLGVQGKYDEAQMVAAPDLSKDKAAANRTFLQNMVASPPTAAGKPAKKIKAGWKPLQIPAQAWVTDTAPATPLPWSAKAVTAAK